MTDEPPDHDPPGSVTFPNVRRLALDDLLRQLVDRAEDVMRTEERLQGLVRATRIITSHLDLPTLLQRVVEEARILVGARYAALGVVGTRGQLVEFLHSGMPPETVTEIGHLPTGGGLLGQLITHPVPLRLRDLATHESSVGFPAGHPAMSSFLGVPVRIRSQVYGNLYLTEKSGGREFTAEDEEVTLSLAATAAAAIDNARLYDSVTRREHWLEAAGAVTNALLDVDDRDEALRLVVHAVQEAAEADHAAVLAADADGVMRFAAAAGPGADKVTGVAAPASSPALLAVRNRSPVLHDDLRDIDGVEGPIKDLGIGPMLAVPLAAHDQVLGALVVGNQPGRPLFTPQDVQMVQEFATQAALVLLLAASRAATKEVELAEERARIARDLHDHAIQAIFGVGLGLNGMATRIGGPDGERMIELVDQLDDSIKAIRRSIFALQRPAGHDPGLRARLERLIARATDSLGFAPTVQTDGPVDSAVPPEVADDLLAVLSEALSNVARHAGAACVDVALLAGPDVILEVRDDGRGIGSPMRRSGLANMAHRAERHGGTCKTEDRVGGGTTVRWTVPLTQEARQEP